MTLNPIPNHAGAIKGWTEHIRAEVAATAKSGHKAWEWIMIIEDIILDDEEFRMPKLKWIPLGNKLRAALIKT